MNNCKHENFSANVQVARILTEGTQDLAHLIAEITVKCEGCGQPMSFLGFPAGAAFDHATVNVNATELFVPMAVGPQQLATNLTYQMPAKRELQ